MSKNVDRVKSQRWTKAPQYNYDGSDWDEDESDIAGNSPSHPPDVPEISSSTAYTVSVTHARETQDVKQVPTSEEAKTGVNEINNAKFSMPLQIEEAVLSKVVDDLPTAMRTMTVADEESSTSFSPSHNRNKLSITVPDSEVSNDDAKNESPKAEDATNDADASPLSSIPSSIPSSVAGHDYAGLNRLSMFLGPGASTIDGATAPVNPYLVTSAFHAPRPDSPSKLRIANTADDSDSEKEDDPQIHLPEEIQELSMDTSDDANKSRRSSYGSIVTSGEPSATDTSASVLDNNKSHERNFSTATGKSESEKLTESLLETLQADAVLDSRRVSMISANNRSTPAYEHPTVDGSSPNPYTISLSDRSFSFDNERGGGGSAYAEGPVPVHDEEDAAFKASPYGEDIMDSGVHTRQSYTSSNEVVYASPSDNREPSIEEDDKVRDKELPNVPDLTYMFITVPNPLPKWNFVPITREKGVVKQRMYFDNARKVEQLHDTGAQSWLKYMRDYRPDVQPFPTTIPLNSSSSRVPPSTLHRTTSAIGHQVSHINRQVLNSRAGEKSVEMMERVGEKSKGLFKLSKRFGKQIVGSER
ncbi:hypothetical protein V1511DRAFT_368122 [Dipodascopsis uninucleata]